MERTDPVDVEYPEATKVPCNDCPWRRNSAPGWLGPLSAEEWVEAAHSEAAIACHITIRGKQAEWDEPGVKQCAGAAIFRSNVFKQPRNPTVATSEERDAERVFAWNDEFIDHHTKGRRGQV